MGVTWGISQRILAEWLKRLARGCVNSGRQAHEFCLLWPVIEIPHTGIPWEAHVDWIGLHSRMGEPLTRSRVYLTSWLLEGKMVVAYPQRIGSSRDPRGQSSEVPRAWRGSKWGKETRRDLGQWSSLFEFPK